MSLPGIPPLVSERLKHLNYIQVVGALVALFLSYQALSVVYCLYLHPLRSIPGPLLARCSRLWYVYHLTRGKLPFAVQKVHDKYGAVVRLAPNELAFIDADAWKAVYGYKHGTGGEMPKDPDMYGNTSAGELSIFSASAQRHGNLRKLLSHGFSEKSLRSQEPIVQNYLDLFIRRLRDLGAEGEPVDIVSWYNFFTFDVIGDLAFNEPFGCLQNGKSHPWIDYTFEVMIVQSFKHAADHYPLFKRLFLMVVPRQTLKAFKTHLEYIKNKALRRFQLQTERPDLMTKMAAPTSGLTAEEFVANADTILLGGSETTATLLSGLTYFLLKNPRALEKLVTEIRTKFSSEEEINFSSVSTMEYSLACIDEALRLYPPVASALLRRTREQDTICGKVVPPNTTVGIFQWAMNRNPAYFAQPEEYIPERWLGDSRFKNDNLNAVQPFSYGPRNCIGRNLAYVEMRLTLTRFLFNFDIKPTPLIEGWTDQNVFLLWQKKPLLIEIIPRDVKIRQEVAELAKML